MAVQSILERIKRPLRGTFVHRMVREARDQLDDLRRLTDPSEMNARYDRQMIRVMRRVLRPDSLCVDVGAHDGATLEPMFALAPKARHYAFEALPHLAAQVRAKFPEANVHDCALSDTSGNATFVHVENDPGYSGLRRRIYDRPDPITSEITVRVARLDDVIPANERVAFLKIDVEGAEYHVLRGAVETIRRGRPVIVFEAGEGSTGQYGVTSRDMYRLITETLDYDVSTMVRWLHGARPITADEFWRSDFYFIATPRDKG